MVDVAKAAKILERVLSGSTDASLRFDDLRQLLIRLRFEERVKGDHHIFTREGVEEIINLQPRGSLAKAYQVKQVRNLVLRYRFGDELA